MLTSTALAGSAKTEPTAPKLVIDAQAWQKMQAYVHRVGNVEINGFAYLTIVDAKTFVIDGADDVFITQQEVTSGTADNDGKAFAKAQYYAVRAGRQDQLRVQWHSHVWGSTYHSATDMGTIESFGAAGMEWFVSIVTNKKGEATARLDVFRPFRFGVVLDVTVVEYPNEAMMAEVAADVTAMVKVKQPRAFAPMSAAKTAKKGAKSIAPGKRRKGTSVPATEAERDTEEVLDIVDDLATFEFGGTEVFSGGRIGYPVDC